MYYSLRITPEFCFDPSNIQRIFSSFRELYDISYCALCFETIDKYGDCDALKPHFHFNFISNSRKKTMQELLNSKYKIKGPRMYALSKYESVDPRRWWRYCMKENLIYAFLPDGLPSIDVLTIEAKAERSTSTIYWKEKRENNKKKLSIFRKVSLILDKKCPGSPQDIFSIFIEYYIKHELSINPRSVTGFVHLYLLKTGRLPLRDYVHQYYVDL